MVLKRGPRTPGVKNYFKISPVTVFVEIFSSSVTIYFLKICPTFLNFLGFQN